MNRQEVTMLLARIQVLDNRQVDALTIEAWGPLMADVPYAAAITAVNDHLRESGAYLLPSHIVAGVRQARRAALPSTMSAERPWCAPAAHRRLADGTCMLCTHREWIDD